MTYDEIYEIALEELLRLIREQDVQRSPEFVERLAGEYLNIFATDFSMRQDLLRPIVEDNYNTLRTLSGTNILPIDFYGPKSAFGRVYLQTSSSNSGGQGLIDIARGSAAVVSAITKHFQGDGIFYHTSIQGHEKSIVRSKLFKSLARRAFYRKSVSRRFEDELSLTNEAFCRLCLRLSAPSALVEQLNVSRQLSNLYPTGSTIFHSFGPASDAALGYARAQRRVSAIETTHGGVAHEIKDSSTDRLIRRINDEYLSWLATDRRFPPLRFMHKYPCHPNGAPKRLHVQGGCLLNSYDLVGVTADGAIKELRKHTLRMRELGRINGFKFKPHFRGNDRGDQNDIDPCIRAEEIISKETLVLLDEPHSTVFYFLLVHEIPFTLVLPPDDIFNFSDGYMEIINLLGCAGVVCSADVFEKTVCAKIFNVPQWWGGVLTHPAYKEVQRRFVRSVDASESR